MNRKFWANKKVLITGYEGFLGSNLTLALIRAGAHIVGLDIKVHRQKTILSKGDLAKITVIKGSVVNYKLMERILREYKIDMIFHLAAEAVVTRSYLNPLRTFQINIKGTWNVLEASRKSGSIEAIIIASSDKAYGSHNQLPYLEKTPLRGDYPYDVSKSCADLLANAYAHTYNLPVAVTRCGNIYGPGDFNFSRLVPDAIRCALTKKTLLIRSDGKFIRDYVYVDDVMSGYIALAQNLRKLNLAGEAFNISNENPVSVLDLVKSIYRLANARPNYKILDQAAYEIKKQYLCAEKAGRLLGWRPRYSLERGLRNTIQWYRRELVK